MKYVNIKLAITQLENATCPNFKKHLTNLICLMGLMHL